MYFRLLKCISDDATWISGLEMIHFMLSMYLSSWWWLHGCIDEFSILQLVSWGLWCVIFFTIFIVAKVRAYNSKGEL